MMDVFFSGLGYGNFILLIFLVVTVHEFGHYYVARLCGVRVLVFSIGFGKEIFGWNDKHGTRWKLSLLPLGGYVKMKDEPTSALESSPEPSPEPSPTSPASSGEKDSFADKALWQKTLIVAAGPAANYLYAVLMLAAMFTFIGQPQATDYRTSGIGEVVQGMPADSAGLQAGDIITHINDRPIDSFPELAQIITEQGGRSEVLKVQIFRQPQENLTLTIRPQTIEQDGRIYYRLGIAHPPPQFIKQNAVSAMGLGVSSVVDWTGLILRSLGGMVVGSVSLNELGGPVRIAQISKNAGSNGAYSWLYLTVIISVNLGLINLLPLPLTDGMHLTLYALQAIRRKPISAKTQNIIMRYGFVFIIGLMLFVVLNDIWQIAL